MSFAEQIERLGPWFHNLHLPNGEQTCPTHPLGDFPAFKWRALAEHLPADLTGKSVLDIGCNAGFYSVELARRGAAVTAVDVDEHYLAQARWAAEVCGVAQRVQFQLGNVYGLASTRKRWDIVLFLGVFYHLRYPLLGLDIVSRCVGETLVFQSLTAPSVGRGDDTPLDLPLETRAPLSEPGWPKLSFIEHKLAGDITNWWAPNSACIEAMLRSSGLEVYERPLDEFYLCRKNPDLPSSMWSWNEAEYLAAVSGAIPAAP